MRSRRDAANEHARIGMTVKDFTGALFRNTYHEEGDAIGERARERSILFKSSTISSQPDVGLGSPKRRKADMGQAGLTLTFHL
jgi:hypothetical protein